MDYLLKFFRVFYYLLVKFLLLSYLQIIRLVRLMAIGFLLDFAADQALLLAGQADAKVFICFVIRLSLEKISTTKIALHVSICFLMDWEVFLGTREP